MRKTLILVHLPVKVSDTVVFGEVRCAKCGHRFELYWVAECREGFTHMGCTSCGEQVAYSVGAATKVDITHEPSIATFVCKDAVDSIQRVQVARVMNKES